MLPYYCHITCTWNSCDKCHKVRTAKTSYEIKLKNAINNSSRERLIGSVIHVYMNKDGAIDGSSRIISTIIEDVSEPSGT